MILLTRRDLATGSDAGEFLLNTANHVGSCSTHGYQLTYEGPLVNCGFQLGVGPDCDFSFHSDSSLLGRWGIGIYAMKGRKVKYSTYDFRNLRIRINIHPHLYNF